MQHHTTFVRKIPRRQATDDLTDQCAPIAGEKTGPISGQPPPVSSEATEAIISSAEKDPKGINAPGQDGGDSDAPKKVKTEKELAKERAKAEKAAKFAAKQAAKQKGSGDAPAAKPKEKKPKEKEEVLPPYVEETPPGEKKSKGDSLLLLQNIN